MGLRYHNVSRLRILCCVPAITHPATSLSLNSLHSVQSPRVSARCCSIKTHRSFHSTTTKKISKRNTECSVGDAGLANGSCCDVASFAFLHDNSSDKKIEAVVGSFHTFTKLSRITRVYVV